MYVEANNVATFLFTRYLLKQIDSYIFAAVSHIATYSIAPMTQRNFDFSVIFSSEYLVGSEKVLTHTHTHTHTHTQARPIN